MSRLPLVGISLALLLVSAVCSLAQDMSVAGLSLGDRESGKAVLAEYLPRTTESGPAYFFYNKNADTVMKVIAASPDDRFFVTEIEVYAVDESYRSRHFQMEKVARFATESGVFIGWHQSGKGIAATLIIGSPYPLGINSISTKDIIRRYGEPTARTKDGKVEALEYRLPATKLAAESAARYEYGASFEFRKGDLRRFSIRLIPRPTP